MSLMPCPGCKVEVDSEQDFCMECGEPIAGMKPAARSEPAPVIATGRPVPRPTAPEMPAARRAAAAKVATKRRNEEPEPVRCPGCGTKTLASRCPGCGGPIRRPDDE
jgi:rRNA maturation endonuclease Nob1